MSALRFLRMREVSKRCGLSRPTLYRNIAAGIFPKPVRIGLKASGWPEHEVGAVTDAVSGGATPEQLRELVQRLLEDRRVRAEVVLNRPAVRP